MADRQNEGRPERARSSNDRESSGKLTQISEAAQAAGRQARDAATAIASQATDQVQEVVQRQVRGAADVVAEVADALRAAGRRMDETMPEVGFIARNAARRIEDLSESVRIQSPTELMQSASAYARRRPAVVFGTTAALGFLMFRLLNAAPPSANEDSETGDRQNDRDRSEDNENERNRTEGRDRSGPQGEQPEGNATQARGKASTGGNQGKTGSSSQPDRKPNQAKTGQRSGNKSRSS